MRRSGIQRIRRVVAGFLLLLLVLLVCPELTAAQTAMLIGTVVQVNEAEQELLLQLHTPVGGYPGHPAYAPPGFAPQHPVLLRVRLPEGEDPEGTMQRMRCLVVNSTVRVWGYRDSDSPDLFRATMVLGAGGRAYGDPTGVRSRLGRGCPLPSRGSADDEDEERPSTEEGGRGIGPGYGRGHGGYGGRGGRGGGGR